MLGIGAATAMMLGLARATEDRRIRVTRRVTGETFELAYGDDGYDEAALGQFSTFARDVRTSEQTAMDPLLLDYLYALMIETESDGAFELVSGFRSASTNEELRRRSAAVAEHSFHMAGRALDLRLPGTHLARLYAAARDLGFGGVGYYARANFIHIDTGPWRRW